jgi:N-acetylglucosaminyldiphosphoundecaprenol N-acetyl-beta-D-mannosaminyltransferase
MSFARDVRDERVDILGVRGSSIMDDAVAASEHWIGNGRRTYVCVTGAHRVMEARRDHRLRRIHNEAGMVTPDGMLLEWL